MKLLHSSDLLSLPESLFIQLSGKIITDICFMTNVSFSNVISISCKPQLQVSYVIGDGRLSYFYCTWINACSLRIMKKSFYLTNSNLELLYVCLLINDENAIETFFTLFMSNHKMKYLQESQIYLDIGNKI